MTLPLLSFELGYLRMMEFWPQGCGNSETEMLRCLLA